MKKLLTVLSIVALGAGLALTTGCTTDTIIGTTPKTNSIVGIKLLDGDNATSEDSPVTSEETSTDVTTEETTSEDNASTSEETPAEEPSLSKIELTFSDGTTVVVNASDIKLSLDVVGGNQVLNIVYGNYSYQYVLGPADVKEETPVEEVSLVGSYTYQETFTFWGEDYSVDYTVELKEGNKYTFTYSITYEEEAFDFSYNGKYATLDNNVVVLVSDRYMDQYITVDPENLTFEFNNDVYDDDDLEDYVEDWCGEWSEDVHKGHGDSHKDHGHDYDEWEFDYNWECSNGSFSGHGEHHHHHEDEENVEEPTESETEDSETSEEE